MGMKLKSGADLCGFELSRFCVQNDVAIPDAPASGRKYFHTGTGMEGKYSLLGRERIYTGTAWRSAAYVDDLANLDLATNADYLALKEKVDLLSGEVDTDAIINNMKEVTAFLSGFAEDANLMSVLDGKLDKSGGTMTGTISVGPFTAFGQTGGNFYLGTPAYPLLLRSNGTPTINGNTLIHSGNVGDYAVKTKGDSTIVDGSLLFQGGYIKFLLSDGSFLGGFNISGNTGKPIFLTQDGEWKTIAFTDSTVEAAKKLVTDNGGSLVHFASNALFVGDTIYPNYQTHILGYDILLRSGASATTGMLINSSGNVIIGPSSTANGRLKIVGENTSASTPALYISNSSGDGLLDVRNNGNVLIGTNEDNGKTLQVNGSVSFRGTLTLPKNNQVQWADTDTMIYGSAGNKIQMVGSVMTSGSLEVGTELGVISNAFINGNLGVGIPNPQVKLHVSQDIVANGTIACKGVAAEGSAPVGTVDKWAGTIAIGTKSQPYTHALGTTDITVAIYEKNGNEWVQILTDVDIVNANTIRVTFGANTTVEHRIVVMG